MCVELGEQQYKILKFLLEQKEPQEIGFLAVHHGCDQAQVAATAVEAQKLGWVVIEERHRKELSLSPKVNPGEATVLPEVRFLEEFVTHGSMSMRDASGLAQARGVELHQVLRWGSQKGWLQKDKGQLHITEEGRKSVGVPGVDERALEILRAKDPPSAFLDELEAEALPGAELERLLGKRPEFARIKERTFRYLSVTDAFRAVAPKLKVRSQRTQLTSEDITSGAWRQIELRPYDVTLEAELAVPVKMHPLQRILQEARRAFLEMGFTEIVSPMVETAFWNFDALFQPQDHPARDMQDTFYMTCPEQGRLPGKKLVERVCRTHQDGWKTGSRGWGYSWSQDEARKMVLRTHTTATTVHALAEDPCSPRKVFTVGRVFRNETISYKHLPEFTQVDGIIIDEAANFSMLLGTLKEFYRKMGFERVKFKPGFFPYTEPSAEVFVYMESKKSWIELGGSGVFRPEVTQPLGCEVPVLAWGLGLERLAMLRYGLTDIRTLYWTELDWLKEVALCR